jgi:hypothetical protein
MLPEPDATGIGCFNLLCLRRHCVGRLIKHISNLATQIDLPGHAHEDWPREADAPRTWAYCPWCEGWYGAGTSALKKAFAQLVDDEGEHERDYPLDQNSSVGKPLYVDVVAVIALTGGGSA